MAADRHEHSRDPSLGAIGRLLGPSLSRICPVHGGGGRQRAMDFSLLDGLLRLAWDLAPGRERCPKA